MNRHLIALAAILALACAWLPTPAAAQLSNANVVTSCGSATYPSGATRAITQDTTGKLCDASNGGGGGASYTAATAPFSVSAGVNKPAGIDTANSAQFTELCKPGTTTCVDPTLPSGVIGADGVNIVSSSNPFNTQDASSGSTGAAPPAKAINNGISQSGVLKGIIGCDLHASYDASDNGSKTLVAGVSAKKIYVCGYTLATGGTATNLSLSSGTGTDCVSTSVNITPAYQLVANDRVGANSAFWNGQVTLANADNLCVKASAGNAHQAEVWYTVQ